MPLGAFSNQTESSAWLSEDLTAAGLFDESLFTRTTTGIIFVGRTQAGNTATATTLATVAANHVAGNLLVAFISWGTAGSAFTSIVDTAGNSWNQAGTEVLTSGSNRIRVYYAWNCLGHASNVVTITWNATTVYRNVDVYQFSNVLVSSSPFIEAKSAVGNSTSVSSGTMDVIVGVAENLTGLVVGLTLNGGQALTLGAGYSQQQYAITGDATTYYTSGYHVAAADEAMTGTQSTGTWDIVASSFKDLTWVGSFYVRQNVIGHTQAVNRASTY